jgi:Domain of unknown function (DUF3303)
MKRRKIAMLFHVTMTHTADNCPAYHSEKMPEVLASLERLEEVGRETNVKAHSLLWGAPAHVTFAVLEADSLVALGRYLNSIAITQEFEITAVQNVSEVIKFGKATMARAKK